MGIENWFSLRTGSQCFNSLELFANFANDSLIDSSGRELRHYAHCVMTPVQPAVNMAPKRYKRSKVWLHFTRKDDKERSRDLQGEWLRSFFAPAPIPPISLKKLPLI